LPAFEEEPAEDENDWTKLLPPFTMPALLSGTEGPFPTVCNLLGDGWSMAECDLLKVGSSLAEYWSAQLLLLLLEVTRVLLGGVGEPARPGVNLTDL